MSFKQGETRYHHFQPAMPFAFNCHFLSLCTCTRSEHKKNHSLATFVFWEHAAEFRYKPVTASQRTAISHTLQLWYTISNP